MTNRFPFALPLLIILIVLNVVFAYDNANADEKENLYAASARYRLPKEIVPVSYDLTIYTHPSDANYDGHVRITLQVLEKTDFIALHTDALSLETNASLSDVSGRSIPIPMHYVYDEETQILTIKLERELEPGKYTLEVSFKGYIANDVFGFYASMYEVDGELRNDTYYVTTFRRTPPISTYLVGWTVHNFVPEQSEISVDFKMWTRDSMKFRGSTALNRGRAVYSALQTWLLVGSPLVKVDQFAIPDFNFHAMENWGLITYRETVVLHENGTTPTSQVLDGLKTMAHEYAHSWFGNLVTPEFWHIVWLKEGFATYFKYYGVSLAEPDLRMMNVFAVDCLQPTLLSDSVDHKRTLNGRGVGSRGSIMATLDFVSYEKGASVIRMINHVIGEAAFQLGLQNYLREMSYRAATPFDLYRNLQASWNRSGQLYQDVLVEDVIESWANQPGYPLITITRNYTTKALFASQERFYLNHRAAQTDSENPGWWIPLTFVTEESDSALDRIVTTVWLEPRATSTLIGSFEPNSWVIFNDQQVGYYRVNYDENNWKMLVDHLNSVNFKDIHVANRAALLDDAFNLARAGYVDYSIPFDIAMYLVREIEYEPWVAAVNNFNFLNRILASSSKVQRLFQKYANYLLKSIYSQLSFIESPTDSSTIKLHREIVLSVACSMNNAHCLKTSKTLFESWISSQESVPADLRSFVYCAGIRLGNNNDWHTVWNKFLGTDLHTEQELLLSALGCTKTPHLINKYLNMSITHSELRIRKQYRMAIVNAVLNGNSNNVNYVMDFISHNLHAICKSRGADFLSNMLTAIGNKVITEVQLSKLRLFVDENIKELGSALDSAKKAVTVATESIAWINKFLPEIERALPIT